MQRMVPVLGALAALMGACGVALAAASTHGGGGENGQTAAYFLILHGGALIGVTACARAYADIVALSRALVIAGGGLGLGTIIFSADLARRAFAGARIFPFAAPIGGSLMILAWVALAAIFATAALRRSR
jgi:uncharacterized membrane protein YgdD (TMEM256/DUF423 family)